MNETVDKKLNKSLILKGNVIYSKSVNQLELLEHGYLIGCGDKVVGVFEEVPKEYQGWEVTDYGDRIIIPGLVDLHTHAPQYTFRGIGLDMELIPWLNNYAFPEESRYQSLEYAKRAYAKFVRDLLNSATTRAVIFGTIHLEATLFLMDLLEASGLHAMVGKVNMDRNSPDNLVENAAQSLKDTEEWIIQSSKRYQSVKPIITPRFIPSCSDNLMEGLGALAGAYGLNVQSHLSENLSEVRWVQELHPDTTCYGEAYEKFGLFGGAGKNKSVMAHCVHCSEAELILMQKNQVFAAHCPESNINLSSGFAPVRTLLNMGIRTGLGSDVAGGTGLSIFKAMAEAIKASKMRWRYVDQTMPALTAAEVFYLATKGGGEFFGKTGSFEKGYDFDAVVLEDESFEGVDMSPEIRLERLIYLAEEQQVVSKYVAGKKVK